MSTITRHQIINKNPEYLENQKRRAKEAIEMYDYKGETLAKLQKIADKGYFIEDGHVMTGFTFGKGYKKSALFFGSI